MPPLTILGNVPIPDSILAYTPSVLNSWPRERQEVWEIHARKPWQSAAAYPWDFLEPPALTFLDQTLVSLGVNDWDPAGHTMVAFADVSLHPDEGMTCNGRAGSIFHLVLRGRAIFHLPRVRDKSLRKLQLEPGLAFVFNPLVHHAVSDATEGDLVTLSAIVPRNPRQPYGAAKQYVAT